MNELQIKEDGRYAGGDVPFGYTLWGDRLVEVPRELDACVTAIRLVKEGKDYPEIAAMTGLAEGTLRAQLCRARRLLMEMLDR